MTGESKVYIYKDINAVVAGEETPEAIPQRVKPPVLRRRWRQTEKEREVAHRDPVPES